jgi:hypothetical protein
MSENNSGSNEKRQIQRISISLPIQVKIKLDRDNIWSEVTHLSDVSTYGAGFTLSFPIKQGQLVFLKMPLPRRLRNYDHAESQYRIWGLVRRSIKTNLPNAKNESRSVGVAFIEKFPPKDFDGNHADFYDLSHRREDGFWAIGKADEHSFTDVPQSEVRRHSRYKIPINIIAEILDRNGNVVKSEPTVMENVSLSGASIFSSLDVEIGTFIRVTSEQYNASIISIVQNKRIGDDKIPRLHIEFIDQYFPLEGIESNLS